MNKNNTTNKFPRPISKANNPNETKLLSFLTKEFLESYFIFNNFIKSNNNQIYIHNIIKGKSNNNINSQIKTLKFP